MRSVILKLGVALALVGFLPLNAQTSPLFHETKNQLTQLEMDLRTASSDIEIVELLIEFQGLIACYLTEADATDFPSEMTELNPIIEAIGHRSNLFYHRFRPYKFSQAYTVQDLNGDIVCFTNTYRSNEPLSEQEKSQLFFLEMNSYEEYGVHPRLTLNEETLGDIEPNCIYNFVVTSDNQIHYALDDGDPNIYLTTDKGISVKRIRAPNHTILAGNQPVLSAGTFVMWQHEDRQLFFVSNDSGHFRPDYESLQVFKKRLSKMGVDRERIILVAIEVDFVNLLRRVKNRSEG